MRGLNAAPLTLTTSHLTDRIRRGASRDRSDPAPGAPAPPAARDTLGTALLIGGIVVALLVAFATPALHFRGADQALLGLSACEACPG
jgi:hypothetical protein